MSADNLSKGLNTYHITGVYKGDYPTDALVEYILHIAHEKDLEINPLEITLTLYRATFDHLVNTGRFLLEEDFEAWHYGPKLRSIQKKYTMVNTYSPLNYDTELEFMTYDKDILLEAVDSEAKKALSTALDIVTSFSNSDLVSMSVKSEPWKKSFEGGEIAVIEKRYIKEEADKISKSLEIKETANRLEALQFKNKVESIYNNRSTLWVEDNISKEHVEKRILNSVRRGETSTFIGKVPFNIDEEIVFEHLKEMFPYFEFSLEDTVVQDFHIIPRRLKVTYIKEEDEYPEIEVERPEKEGLISKLFKD